MSNEVCSELGLGVSSLHVSCAFVGRDFISAGFGKGFIRYRNSRGWIEHASKNCSVYRHKEA